MVTAFFAFRAAAFNHIGVNGALGEEARTLAAWARGLEFFGLGFEDINKQTADDFAFGFGFGHACEFAQE